MTPRQHDYLTFVIRYIASHGGVSPSYKEIALGVGITTSSRIFGVLEPLVRGGYLRMTLGLARSIEVLRGPPDLIVVDIANPHLNPIDRRELKRIAGDLDVKAAE